MQPMTHACPGIHRHHNHHRSTYSYMRDHELIAAYHFMTKIWRNQVVLHHIFHTLPWCGINLSLFLLFMFPDGNHLYFDFAIEPCPRAFSVLRLMTSPWSLPTSSSHVQRQSLPCCAFAQFSTCSRTKFVGAELASSVTMSTTIDKNKTNFVTSSQVKIYKSRYVVQSRDTGVRPWDTKNAARI